MEMNSLLSERIKYKSLLKKKCKREDEGSYGSGKTSDQKEHLIKTDISKDGGQGKW